MLIPTLLATLETGEGLISTGIQWKTESALLRADLLKDWIHGLTNLYNVALNDMDAEYKAMQRHKNI